MSSPIVTQGFAKTKFDPPEVPQTFTIRCAECADEVGTHLSDCPTVIAAGYHTGHGAAAMRVFPEAGSSFATFQSALSAFRHYLRIGPVELRMEDGRVITMKDIDW